MNRYFGGPIVSAMSLIFFFSTPTSAGVIQGDNDHLIVPGQRIGPVTLGMSDNDLFKLGAPESSMAMGRWVAYFYDDMKVFVGTSTHKVGVIVLYKNSSYHTERGARIGSSVGDVFSAMGAPERTMGNGAFGYKTYALIYASATVEFSFYGEDDDMSKRPSDTVQEIEIQLAGSNMF